MKAVIPHLFYYNLEQTVEFLMWSCEEITSHHLSPIIQKRHLFKSLIKPTSFLTSQTVQAS